MMVFVYSLMRKSEFIKYENGNALFRDRPLGISPLQLPCHSSVARKQMFGHPCDVYQAHL